MNSVSNAQRARATAARISARAREFLGRRAEQAAAPVAPPEEAEPLHDIGDEDDAGDPQDEDEDEAEEDVFL